MDVLQPQEAQRDDGEQELLLDIDLSDGCDENFEDMMSLLLIVRLYNSRRALRNRHYLTRTALPQMQYACK